MHVREAMAWQTSLISIFSVEFCKTLKNIKASSQDVILTLKYHRTATVYPFTNEVLMLKRKN